METFANTVKTLTLMAAMTVLLIIVGEWFGGRAGLIYGLILAIALNVSAYWYSDRFAATLTGARPVSEDAAPSVYRGLRELTHDIGMPMPRVYEIPTDQLNAFAAGRDPAHSIVAVTRGLVNSLDDRQLRGVLAHELAHIRNRDILISTVAAVMAGALTVVARIGLWQLAWGGRGSRRQGNPLIGVLGILAIIFAPIAAILIRMAVSRVREFQADRTAAALSGDPEGLAGALERLAGTGRRHAYNVNEAAAHMFIVSPLRGGALSGLFSTHPPIGERVRRLRNM